MPYFEIQLLKSEAVSLTLFIFFFLLLALQEDLVLQVRDKSLKKWAFVAAVKYRKNKISWYFENYFMRLGPFNFLTFMAASNILSEKFLAQVGQLYNS